jgi:ABC-type multidrug transport system fused ATPase/permease subunit
MITQEGRVDVGGTIAYVPQTPWVQNLSLRDNILFGMPYDEAKYKAVIHACALELDLKILPNGALPHLDFLHVDGLCVARQPVVGPERRRMPGCDRAY